MKHDNKVILELEHDTAVYLIRTMDLMHNAAHAAFIQFSSALLNPKTTSTRIQNIKNSRIDMAASAMVANDIRKAIGREPVDYGDDDEGEA